MAPRTSAIASKNWPIESLPGLSHGDAEALKTCGIVSTLQLLQETMTVARREALLAKIQCHSKHVSKWAALADLARIPGVGCEYCGLLLHAGIGSTAQLAQASVHRLHPQLLRLHVATMQRRDLCPTAQQVTQWIFRAGQLS
jgi:hypothetical protein